MIYRFCNDWILRVDCLTLIFFSQKNVDTGKNDGSSGSYDTICGARLPRGLDPHSVSSDELSASLGSFLLP